jgi:pilus assembly protein Flp/PilA
VNTFIRMLKDQTGASAAEYALILAIVGTGIAIAAWGLGQAIGGAMNSASGCINEGGGATAPTC